MYFDSSAVANGVSHHQQLEPIQEQQDAVAPPNEFEHVVMVDPAHQQREESDHEREIGRPVRQQRADQRRPPIRDGHMDVEHEERHGEAEDPVA
jgi:hypothetical protein